MAPPPLTLPPPLDTLKLRGPTTTYQAVVKGGTFIALAGSKSDGRGFIPQAIEKGAKIIIYHHQLDWASRIADAQKKHPKVTFLGLPYDPRRLLPDIARAAYRKLPPHLVGITGTNGKTSTAYFVYQLMRALGEEAAFIGTNPFEATLPVALSPEVAHTTTPDILALYRLLHDCAKEGIATASIEASSHGLHQNRLGYLKFQGAAFLNLTPEHLDYHRTMEDYYKAKKLLFTSHLGSSPGGQRAAGRHKRHFAVINIDDPYGHRLYDELSTDLAQHLKKRQLYIYPFGTKATIDSFGRDAFHLTHVTPLKTGLSMGFSHGGEDYRFDAPFFGTFQASNLLAALILTHYISGYAFPSIIEQIPSLLPPTGRMEQIITTPAGAKVFVDYAHTPDALEKALGAMRCHTTNDLWLVFGCGGDRDPLKRPTMGALAQKLADKVIITDDNPRTEDPELIRQAIAAECPKALLLGDRRRAIEHALKHAKKGDCVLVTGKGHEEGQTVGTTVLPFSDQRVILEATAKHTPATKYPLE